MAYQYIDDSAHAAVSDDGPLSSAAAVLMRRNLAEVYAERAPHGGWMAGASAPWRVCSCWPTPWSIGVVYVHSDDIGCTIDVQVRLDAVDWSVDDTAPPAGGSDGIRLAASVCTPDGRIITPDRDDPAAWESLDTTTTDQTVTLTASTGGWSGWLGILLWTYSYTQEEDGVSATTYLNTGIFSGLEVASLGRIATQPPERGVTVEFPVDKGSTWVQQGPMFQIGGWTDDTAESTYHLHLIPSWRSYSSGPPGDVWLRVAPRVTYHTMGVAVIDGVSWRMIPPAIEPIPGERTYHTDRAVSERSTSGLVGQLVRTTRRRVPHQVTDPGMVLVSSSWVRWPLRTNREGGRISTSYEPVLSTLVSASNPGQDAGWEAIVGVISVWGGAFPDDIGQGRSAWRAKLSAKKLDSGSWVEVDSAESVENGLIVMEQYIADPSVELAGYYAQTMWGSDQYTAWQMRGALLQPDQIVPGAPPEGDHRRVQWIKVRLDGTDVIAGDYPLRLEMQLKQVDNEVADIVEVFAGIRSLPLDWEV